MIVERVRGRSSARRFPVASARGTVYLTGLQWELWRQTTAWRHHHRGLITLTRLQVMTRSSRGRCWHALARLRQLGLIGFRAWPVMDPAGELVHAAGTALGEVRPRRPSPGCRGQLLVWQPRGARLARSLRWTDPAAIDSTSTPYGRYLSREGLSTAAARQPHRWCPPGTGGCGARAGPRRGHAAPRALWSHCPVGHRVRLQRRSWTVAAALLTWRGEGWCRRCRAGTVETIELPHPVLARPFSVSELVDPAVFERRRQAAAELIIARRLRADRADRYRVDYLEPDRERVSPAGDGRIGPADLPWLRRP